MGAGRVFQMRQQLLAQAETAGPGRDIDPLHLGIGLPAFMPAFFGAAQHDGAAGPRHRPGRRRTAPRAAPGLDVEEMIALRRVEPLHIRDRALATSSRTSGRRGSAGSMTIVLVFMLSPIGPIIFRRRLQPLEDRLLGRARRQRVADQMDGVPAAAGLRRAHPPARPDRRHTIVSTSSITRLSCEGVWTK